MSAKRKGPLRTIFELLSLKAPRSDAAAFAAIESYTDWPSIFVCAGHCLITPALRSALTNSGQINTLTPEEREYLEEISLLNRDRNRFLKRELARVAAELNGLSIKPILLKGAIALLPDQYPGSEDRILTDFDLLVPEEYIDKARHALVTLGYEQECSYARWLTPGEQDRRHHITSLVHPSMPICVELHRRLLTDHGDSALLSKHMVLEEVHLSNDASVMLPDPYTRLLHNMLHAQVGHRGAFSKELDVRQLYEFMLLARHHRDRIAVDGLLQRLRPHRQRLLYEYWAMAERWLGLTYPSELPRSPREWFELMAVEVVSFNYVAKRVMRLANWSVLLPQRLVIAAKRTWTHPGFLAYRLKRVLLR